MSTHDKNDLVKFIASHGIENKVAYYYKIQNGEGWYSLIYGLYPMCSKAREGLKQLPDNLNVSSPWIQGIASVQTSINNTSLNALNIRRVE